MVRFLPALCLSLGVISCSSDQVKPMEEPLKSKQTTNRGSVGLDEDGQIVYQEEETLQAELDSQVWANNALGDRLKLVKHELGSCRKKIARLADRGEYTPLPKTKTGRPIPPDSEYRIKDDGRLVKLSRQGYSEKMDQLREQEERFRVTIEIIQEHLEQCEFALQYRKDKQHREQLSKVDENQAPEPAQQNGYNHSSSNVVIYNN